MTQALTTTDNGWGRIEGETARSYEGFCIYRDLGPGRSLREAEHEYRTRHDLEIPDKLPTALFERWSSKFKWVSRSQTFDESVDQEILKEIRRDNIRSRQRQARQVAEAAEVLTFPLKALADRIKSITEGRRLSELDDLSDAEFIALGRSIATALPALQKAERDALGIADDPAGSTAAPKTTTVTGKVLRQVLNNPEAIGALEAIAFEISAQETVEEAHLVPGGLLRSPPAPASGMDDYILDVESDEAHTDEGD